MKDPIPKPSSSQPSESAPSQPIADPVADLLAQLQTAIDGLQWISESDFPFEVVQWAQNSEPTPDLLLKLTDHDPETPVQTEAIESFFEWAVQPQDWQGPEAAATVERYKTLLQLLQKHLQNPQVYRLGEVNVDVYILGKANGELIGVKTQAVET